jgi:hypothetical protein
VEQATAVAGLGNWNENRGSGQKPSAFLRESDPGSFADDRRFQILSPWKAYQDEGGRSFFHCMQRDNLVEDLTGSTTRYRWRRAAGRKELLRS